MKRHKTTDERRFWGHVNTKTGPLMPGMTSRCWMWLIATDGNYGEFTISQPKYVVKYAHAFAWELFGGPSPTRKFPLHHLCGNKLCVNPNHMAMVTRAGHSRIHIVISDAKCKNGHPFDKVNPLIDGKGYRRCRECANESRVRSKNMQEKSDAKKSPR